MQKHCLNSMSYIFQLFTQLADRCARVPLLRKSMRLFGLSSIGALLILTLLNACAPNKNYLEQVMHHGELRVVTRHAPTTYYEGPHGATGLEYELVKRFADHLGVELKIVVADNVGEIFTMLRNGEANFAAAGLTATPARQAEFRFTPPYQMITQQLIYNSSNKSKPKTLDGLGGIFEVAAQSSHSENLAQLKLGIQGLNWLENADMDTNELLNNVAEGLLDYTLADSNEFANSRRYYPELQIAFDVTEQQPLAWAFPRGKDDSLYNEAVAFFNKITRSGELDEFLAHSYQHVKSYDYRGTQTFLTQIRQRLPQYREQIELAASKYDIDWRLLAAVAYQESHWNPNAVSPTGVKGMMMLTQATADSLGVETRTDAEESILGGARYLRGLIDKIPDRITEPDRTWIALAAYNIGYGHLEDARVLTQLRGGNPDKWLDIKANLPLLNKSKWYKKTRYGYARGHEPIRYVDNIRSYYDILTWYLEREDPQRIPSPMRNFNFHLL